MDRAIELFAANFDNVGIAITVADPAQPDCPLVYANLKFEELTLYGRQDAIGLNCRFLQGPDTDEEDVRVIREAIATGAAEDVVIQNYRADGTGFSNYLILETIQSASGNRYILGSQFEFRLDTKRAAFTARMEAVDQELAKLQKLRQMSVTNLQASMKSRSDRLLKRLRDHGWHEPV